MFDRHQAEITVMQFRGHSLPVHQSMSVSWAFTLSHFVNQIRLRDFLRLLAIGMCHFLPVHHFGMACVAGSKVNIQHRILVVREASKPSAEMQSMYSSAPASLVGFIFSSNFVNLYLSLHFLSIVEDLNTHPPENGLLSL